MRCAAAAELPADVLPVEDGVTATTPRAHALRIAKRIEAELGEERLCFVDGCFVDGCLADGQELPIPEGRIAVGLDGGFLRDWSEKKANFEVSSDDRCPRIGQPATSAPVRELVSRTR